MDTAAARRRPTSSNASGSGAAAPRSGSWSDPNELGGLCAKDRVTLAIAVNLLAAAMAVVEAIERATNSARARHARKAP